MKTQNNFQFINSFYIKRKWDAETQTNLKDSLYLIYKNLNTGEKKYKRIDEPKMDVYVLKEEHEKDYYESFVPLDHCEPVKIPYYNREERMAKILSEIGVEMVNPVTYEYMDAKEWYKLVTTKNSGLYSHKGKVHQSNIFYSSDLDIEDYYKGVFIDKYGSHLDKPTKGFYDIEVDTIAVGYEGFPDENEAPAPVNAITYVDHDSMTSFTYLLRNENNPQIQELEDNLDEFIDELKVFFKDYGDYKYDIRFFTREIDLIKAFFNDVNRLQPDFMGGKLF